uniref:Outer membrane protein beta-barrel domain-containing protein n=1 Tax=candidate division WOR-3 bacterium TaxID=2052148 RepID=A0A7C4TFY8_UNCW3
MIVFLIFTELINPYLSANLLAPDDYSDDYFSHIYQFSLENDFYRKDIGWGIYLDYFYKKDYPYSDPYFIKSGLPVGINAGGVGLQLKYLGIGDIEIGIKLGYYAGKITYPILGDSGRVIQKTDTRNSLGFGLGVNLLHNFGRMIGGLKFWTNLIPFGAKNVKYHWYSQRSPDYISLNTVGFGLVLGLGKRQEK